MKLLTTKFGPLGEKTISTARAIDSVERLDGYFNRVLEAGSLEELGLDD